MKILIAGFQHETNTFSKTKTSYEDFVRGGVFPAMAIGDELLKLVDVDIAMGGFIRTATRLGWNLQPAIWAGATPAAQVTADAFERIASIICDQAVRTSPEAIYLDLHGAMVCEHTDDGEGELLRRLRTIVGPDIPIVASLDLHANVTEQMLRLADLLIAYRTYPHEDMAKTGSRAASMMHAILDGNASLYCGSRRLPFLIPINAMATDLSPAGDAYALLQRMETQPEIASLSLALGFPASDFPECGGVIWGYGASTEAVEKVVDTLYRCITDNEAAWNVSFLTPEDAVRQAMAIAREAHRPVIIADTQDNPGAGGTSDSMGLLRALIDLGAEDAAIGLVVDADAAAKAHEAGVGADVELALGGKSGAPGDAPYQGRFRVEFLADGRCTFEGPMMRGKSANVGPSARLAIRGVKIAVCSATDQMLDRSLYRMVGIEPEAMKILVNKSSVHFRADFEPISEAILVAKSPGLVLADPGDLPWTRLAPELRVKPLGPAFAQLRRHKPFPAPSENSQCATARDIH